MSTAIKWLRRVVVALIVFVAVLVLAAWIALRASLPKLDGDASLAKLTAPVTVTRDAIGVVTVEAASRPDAYRALGFVHGQERYFEMDLMRRVAAGELSALFGAAALPADRAVRPHRFRHRAEAVLAAATPEERASLAAYVEGVNAGREALSARQFPYLLLRQQPQPWREADSVLVTYSMFLDLNRGTEARELALGRMRALLPPALDALLASPGTPWDAPMVGTTLPEPALPAANDVDLRTLPRDRFGRATVAATGDLGVGSNNFAVGGALTANGAGMVANDMHLGLRVPNIWFRARLRFPTDQGERVDITGVTLPGVPAVVAGSNGHVAWGFTNTYGDWMDWARVRWTDASKTTYAAVDGTGTARRVTETIEVANGPSETLEVVETDWGPVLAEWDAQTSLALDWIAHHAEAVNFRLPRLETAHDVGEAIAIANTCGIPPQNFVVVDAKGRLAWTVIGQMPERRPDYDPQRPADWPLAGGWSGWLAPERHPRIVDPADGRLWSANSRTVDGEMLALLGDGGFALGARGAQIRDDLRAKQRFTPADLLAIQLDDRALFLEPWWRLLRSTLAKANDPGLAELDRLTATWGGRAVPDSVDYRLVRAFRLFVHEAVLDGLAAPARGVQPDFVLPGLGQGEGTVWRLVQQRPAHLLAPIYSDWDALLAASAKRVVTELGTQPGGLAARRWGERNTTAIKHPLSRAVPQLSWLLDTKPRELPGDVAMPRVQGTAFGASERFAVSPGHEDEGYFHMPGGQSGHPLSPFYTAGHAAWENGEATPFLPGEAKYSLVLRPN